MRRFTAFYILAAIVMAAILLAAFPGTRRWLFRRFKTLDYLSDYITAFHNSFLDINEEGTEAAAATAMLVRLIIFPITPPAELAPAMRAGFRSGGRSVSW